MIFPVFVHYNVFSARFGQFMMQVLVEKTSTKTNKAATERLGVPVSRLKK
jgi:hypothetical protein